MWDKKIKSQVKNLALKIVALEGFEPSQAEPESDVLPLHHKAIFEILLAWLLLFRFDSAKVRMIFETAK